ncbi:RpiB/LacA/LacB family sugar-phosphate isomerase [Psychrosphaera sp. B3R10]|uniref:RpiB/LacA/LacB family sugar-phosphate isomerase n=1 Tax=unclassified Psychrosphaera TaxID=2641570 RepID=UPI001C0959BC|nr:MULTISPECIES: RpiB/LacA/LacB family sugar-phosphate isomerase [unclassified Psychrosphaera]MBU2883540.1 RpiB/LacA/LacB family sugar-phosphate isomerase [Psychrosphaera sp. I2R16]MBU2989719.1 RpiB/LacA/LacB family sugar-phosphate isomerase [Psychrosphaera sp. B3R10]
MKIALMMENSQANKNDGILTELEYVAKPLGHNVFNVGMNNANDHHLTYIHLGIMAGILLNAKAVDFVFTGCGTGQGAMMASNAHAGVFCGYCIDPSDAFLFNQVNNGNALALPFAKGFGWGAELNARYIFEKALTGERGAGYPLDRKEPQVKNANILTKLKSDLIGSTYVKSLENLDQNLVKEAVGGERFQACLFEHGQDQEIINYVKSLLH